MENDVGYSLPLEELFERLLFVCALTRGLVVHPREEEVFQEVVFKADFHVLGDAALIVVVHAVQLGEFRTALLAHPLNDLGLVSMLALHFVLLLSLRLLELLRHHRGPSVARPQALLLLALAVEQVQRGQGYWKVLLMLLQLVPTAAKRVRG